MPTTTRNHWRPLLVGALATGLGILGPGVLGPGSARAAGPPSPARPMAASAADDATIVPDASWTCGRPSGIVPPTRGKVVLRATVPLSWTHDVGTTQYGHRRVLGGKAGTFTGDRSSGTVLAGGLDLELTLSNGSVELEEVTVLKANDGGLAYLRTCGVAPSGEQTVRIVPDFEAANSGSLSWLNNGQFVGTRTLDAAANTLTLTVYDVSGVAAAEPRIQLKDPTGVPNQPWDCATATGTKGASVFTESVTLGSSVAVGASKRGTRNIIPITGGRTTGRLTGAILNGGADYQLMGGSSATLDARYVLAPSDGEFVVVRNCGPMGRLVPTFEARAGGPYAFLNANTFLSSDPGMASGGVSITFYERR